MSMERLRTKQPVSLPPSLSSHLIDILAPTYCHKGMLSIPSRSSSLPLEPPSRSSSPSPSVFQLQRTCQSPFGSGSTLSEVCSQSDSESDDEETQGARPLSPMSPTTFFSRFMNSPTLGSGGGGGGGGSGSGRSNPASPLLGSFMRRAFSSPLPASPPRREEDDIDLFITLANARQAQEEEERYLVVQECTMAELMGFDLKVIDELGRSVKVDLKLVQDSPRGL